MSQNHFTLSSPLKSPADAKAVAEQLPPLMPQLFQAADTNRMAHAASGVMRWESRAPIQKNRKSCESRVLALH